MDKTKVAIGVDVGGTNTAYGYVSESGKIIYESSIPTRAEQRSDQLFDRLFKEINSSFKKFAKKYELVGIGIGAPNANYYTGSVDSPPNLNWGSVNVLKVVKKYSPLPSAITNDANAAAIGEIIFGAARGMKDFIVITLVTGLRRMKKKFITE